MNQERIRAFIAIELALDVREALAEAVEVLGQAPLGGLRLVQPGNTHLTLKFLGEIGIDTIAATGEALGRAATGVPSFVLNLGQPGAFPRLKHPSVLWVGLQGDLDALQGLKQGVENVLKDLGLPRERRPFSPHLTLARVRPGTRLQELSHIREALGRLAVRPASLAVREVTLMRSELKPTGAVYTRLASASLGRREPP